MSVIAGILAAVSANAKKAGKELREKREDNAEKEAQLTESFNTENMSKPQDVNTEEMQQPTQVNDDDTPGVQVADSDNKEE